MKRIMSRIFICMGLILPTSVGYGQSKVVFKRPSSQSSIRVPRSISLSEISNKRNTEKNFQKYKIDRNVKKLVISNNKFAFELYGQLKNSSNNVFFSPYSISSAFAMTFAGAKGNTETEIADVFRFSLKQNQTHEAFYKISKVFEDIQNEGNIQLSVGNSLWIQNHTKIIKSFLYLTSKYYTGSINYVDFLNNSESARKTVNAWVEDKTNNKIMNLLQSGDVNANTKLVLCNAIYFKGNWDLKFNESNTKDRKFYLSKSKNIEQSTMSLLSDFKYKRFDDFSAVSIPYKGQTLSMIIFLPNEIDGLSQLEKKLTPRNALNWIHQIVHAYSPEVDLRIPKFRITNRVKLSDILKAMGVNRLFSNADLSGISDSVELQVSEAIHQAFVEVNEEGTEAAAATAIMCDKTCSLNAQIVKPVKFYVDHPFIFMLRDNITNSVLFMGKITNPQK